MRAAAVKVCLKNTENKMLTKRETPKIWVLVKKGWVLSFWILSSSTSMAEDCPPNSGTLPIAELTKVACAGLVEKAGLESHLHNRLSPLWSQEIIGLDILWETMNGEKNRWRPVNMATPEAVPLLEFPKEKLSGIAKDILECSQRKNHGNCKHLDNLDSVTSAKDFRSLPRYCDYSHGLLTAQLMAGNYPFGGSPAGRLVLPHFRLYNDGSTYSLDFLADLKREKVSIMSISTMTPGSLFTSEEIRKLPAVYDHDRLIRNIPTNKAWHEAAGNDFIAIAAAGNMGLDQIRWRSDKQITVGSLSPVGVMTALSNDNPDTEIVAPSDEFLATPLCSPFGQSSGATPLVAAALSAAMAYLPGLTMAESRQLIAKAAIPSSARAPITYPVLNSVRMLEVARRLQKGWPKNRSQIFDLKTYDFRAESKTALEKAEGFFQNKNDACAKRRGFFHLRRSYLLNPENLGLAGKIANIYEEEGYTINALFYHSRTGITLDFLKKAYEISGGAVEVRGALVRAALALNTKESVEFFTKELFPMMKEGQDTPSGNGELYALRTFCDRVSKRHSFCQGL